MEQEQILVSGAREGLGLEQGERVYHKKAMCVCGGEGEVQTQIGW